MAYSQPGFDPLFSQNRARLAHLRPLVARHGTSEIVRAETQENKRTN